jgi:hypothetical protein
MGNLQSWDGIRGIMKTPRHRTNIDVGQWLQRGRSGDVTPEHNRLVSHLP